MKEVTLQRRLTLPLLVLYGLGVTIGAGIYVLVGLTAVEAGQYTPISFLLAALIVGFSGLSYAQLSTMLPVSAGEAMYVEHAFQLKWLTLMIGLMIAVVGLVSAATISIGAASYLQQLMPMPLLLLLALIVIGLGGMAAWGILESVAIAAVFTVIEIAGLAFVVGYALTKDPALVARANELIPPFELAVWSGVASGGLIAFFAFVGFEDLANIAEEAKAPEKTMPAAILWTLVISTVVYLLVTSVIVLSVPLEELQRSSAPLTLIFSDEAAYARGFLTLIAGIATLNGVLIQLIMASRVFYGLAAKGRLPSLLATVHPKTRTPIVATALATVITLVLALIVPVQALAETTSTLVLVVFAIVNLSLIRLKSQVAMFAENVFQVPDYVPWIGLLTCVGLLATVML